MNQVFCCKPSSLILVPSLIIRRGRGTIRRADRVLGGQDALLKPRLQRCGDQEVHSMQAGVTACALEGRLQGEPEVVGPEYCK
jgi:hypothetical protein